MLKLSMTVNDNEIHRLQMGTRAGKVTKGRRDRGSVTS
jgi:hypothetical protein